MMCRKKTISRSVGKQCYIIDFSSRRMKCNVKSLSAVQHSAT